jgi:threonine synthase
MRAVEKSSGFFIDVTDSEIMKAVMTLGRTAGVFAEPAGATSLAGYIKCLEQGMIDRKASAVAIVSGNGLKDVDAALRSVGDPLRVAPELSSLEELVDGLDLDSTGRQIL